MRSRFYLAAALFALAACSDSKDSSSAADSALDNDLTLAAQAQPAELAIADTALTPVSGPREPIRSAPTTPKPRPKPAPARVTPPPEPEPEAEPARAPSPRTGTIAAGTTVSLNTGSRVCTGVNRPGDKFTAVLTGAAVGSNGVVIPAGSKAVVEVASATSGQDGLEPSIAFRVRSIETPSGAVYRITGDATSSNPLEKQRAESNSKKTDAKKVIGGAIAGAILGQAIGKDAKGTIIGAAAGAAAGTVAAKATAKYDACLPENSLLTLSFGEPVEIPLQ
jgi:hypothetical protein